MPPAWHSLTFDVPADVANDDMKHSDVIKSALERIQERMEVGDCAPLFSIGKISLHRIGAESSSRTSNSRMAEAGASMTRTGCSSTSPRIVRHPGSLMMAHLCRAVLKTAENSPPRRNVNLCSVLFVVYDEYTYSSTVLWI